MNRKGECELLGPAGRCELLKGPIVLHFLRRQRQNKASSLLCSRVPAMAATASASWHRPGGKGKMAWKVLVSLVLLQAQLPVTGKAGRIRGKERLETVHVCVGGDVGEAE